MHEIRTRALEVLHEPVRERQVQVAGAEQVLHADSGAARRVIDAGTGRADEDRLVAACGERFDQVQDLLRPAVEMAPGFHMQYFHDRRQPKTCR